MKSKTITPSSNAGKATPTAPNRAAQMQKLGEMLKGGPMQRIAASAPPKGGPQRMAPTMQRMTQTPKAGTAQGTGQRQPPSAGGLMGGAIQRLAARPSTPAGGMQRMTSKPAAAPVLKAPAKTGSIFKQTLRGKK